MSIRHAGCGVSLLNVLFAFSDFAFGNTFCLGLLPLGGSVPSLCKHGFAPLLRSKIELLGQAIAIDLCDQCSFVFFVFLLQTDIEKSVAPQAQKKPR